MTAKSQKGHKRQQALEPQIGRGTLFHYPHAGNQARGIGEYVGSIVTPDGRVYTIEGTVQSYSDGEKLKKFFALKILGSGDVIKSMLRGARVDGEMPPGLMDLVAQAEGKPFDDALPEGMGIGAAAPAPDVPPKKAVDGCERCHGAKGGVPGNENIVGGVRLCDYCHAEDLMKASGVG